MFERGNAEDIINAVKVAREIRGSSDVHIAAKEESTVRIDGEPRPFSPPIAFSRASIEAFVEEAMDDAVKKELKDNGNASFIYDSEDTGPLRVHVTNTVEGAALAIRLLPNGVPKFERLHLPSAVRRLAETRGGASFVVGPTGSGKSTTLAAVAELINRERACIICTIEEGIEYRFLPARSRFRQVEVGASGQAPNYRTALKGLLRSDPDVVIVAECRDPESLAAMLMIAESGRRTIGTVHADSASALPDRVIGAFPADMQPQVRQQLAGTLQEVVVMRLPPCASGEGRVPACEVLLRTDGLTTAILKPEEHSTEAALYNIMQSGRTQGMITMEDSLIELWQDNKITEDAAREFAIRKNVLEEKMKRATRVSSANGEAGRREVSGFEPV